MNFTSDPSFMISYTTESSQMLINKRQSKIIKYIFGAALLVMAGTLAVICFKQELSVESQTQFADLNPQVPYGHAVFWWDNGYSGNSFEMQLGGMQEAQLFNMGWNDVLSSFKIGEGVRAKICKHKYCQDESHWDTVIDILGPYNAPQMYDTNDWASHIWIYPYNPQTEKYVQLFSKENFDVSHAGIFPVGFYNSDDIKSHHIDKGGYEGSASSMIVPDGLTLTIFQNDRFSGQFLTFQGPIKADFVIGEQSNNNGWDLQIRSLYVQQTQRMSVNVYWERVASQNGPIVKTIEVGWSNEESQIDQNTVKNSFTASANKGYIFKGQSSKFSLSKDQSGSIRDSVMQALQTSKKIHMTARCSNLNNESVSLYQWVLVGEGVGESSIHVRDSSYICRYGVNANSSPACPLTMCADSQCSTCIESFNPYQ
eukprot:403369131